MSRPDPDVIVEEAITVFVDRVCVFDFASAEQALVALFFAATKALYDHA